MVVHLKLNMPFWLQDPPVCRPKGVFFSHPPTPVGPDNSCDRARKCALNPKRIKSWSRQKRFRPEQRGAGHDLTNLTKEPLLGVWGGQQVCAENCRGIIASVEGFC